MFWWQKSDKSEPTDQPDSTTPQQLQLSIQLLYEDEGLTSALTDEDAKVLLTWGQTQLEQLVNGSPQADLEQATHTLRRLLRGINQLVAKRAELSDADFIRRLLKLTEQWSAFRDSN